MAWQAHRIQDQERGLTRPSVGSRLPSVGIPSDQPTTSLAFIRGGLSTHDRPRYAGGTRRHERNEHSRNGKGPMERPIITVQQHILDEQQNFPGVSGEFSWLLSGITLATKMIQAKVRRAGLSDILGSDTRVN